MNNKPHYSKVSKEKLRHYQALAMESRRSPELKHAWANADKLREEFKTSSPTELAKKYKINRRAVYRIVNGR